MSGLKSLTALVLLLAGGDKKSQAKDIKAALKYWKAYREE
jgi:putative component of toxin-antitoxin plasmid stabilization module